jgi:uncharacterized protein YjbI with pentapeptide repeats
MDKSFLVLFLEKGLLPCLPMGVVMKIQNAAEALQVDNADLSGSAFNNVKLAGSRFENVSLAEIAINDANLSGASITNANIQGMTIDGVLVSDLLQAYRTGR